MVTTPTRTASRTRRVPLVDLKAQHRALRPALEKALLRVARSGRFILGPEVESFEKAFAAYLGVRHFVACQSGTSAITLMLRAAGIGPGDEVVTTPLTAFATAQGIVQAGAVPVYADVDPRTLNLDPARAAKAITKRTRALLPVHLYGRPADMDALNALARDRDLLVFEDAAQAAGASYRGRKAGALANAAAFSFYPSKNLGACGDAGGIATGDAALARGARRLRDHGLVARDRHALPGAGNERLSAFQGAVLGVKLPRLDGWNAARRRRAAAYRELLDGTPGLAIVAETPGAVSNAHLFVVRHARRDALLARLRAAGIMAEVHYPVPGHLQPALGARRGRRGDFPVAERACAEVLSLPLYPELRESSIRRAAAAIRAFLA